MLVRLTSNLDHLRQFPWTSETQVDGMLHPGLANEMSKDITQLMMWEIR